MIILIKHKKSIYVLLNKFLKNKSYIFIELINYLLKFFIFP